MKPSAFFSCALVSSSLLLQACSDSTSINNSVAKPEAPKQVLYSNARIYSMNETAPWAEAMVTDGNTITFIGDEQDALSFVDKKTAVVDLHEQFVIPGLIDTHTHPGLVGILSEDDSEEGSTQLPTESKEALYDFLRQYRKDNLLQPFVMLEGWDVASFLPEGPNKTELDAIFPWRPVLLMDNSGHSSWANTTMLKLLGADKDTPDLSTNISYFVRNENGEPTGWIKEFAAMPKLNKWLSVPKDELKNRILSFLNFLSQRGVTALWDAGNFNWDHDVYQAIAELDQEGLLPLRYEGSYHIWAPDQIDSALQTFKQLRENYAGNRLQFNTIKIHYDGVHEVLTAGMLEPYTTDADNHGGVLFNAPRLSQFMQELNAEGIHLHLHTVGDGAVREVLNAVELTQQRLGEPLNIEITLSHVEHVNPADIPRFAALNVHANFTPHWFGGSVFGDAGALNLGHERASHSQVVGEFFDAGVNVTLSSDVVSKSENNRADPFIGMQMSITRQEYNNAQGPVLSPASASLTLEQALHAYTRNSAEQLGYGSALGSLEVGKRADFVVLNQSPFNVNTNDLHKIQPQATVLDGITVQGSLTLEKRTSEERKVKKQAESLITQTNAK